MPAQLPRRVRKNGFAGRPEGQIPEDTRLFWRDRSFQFIERRGVPAGGPCFAPSLECRSTFLPLPTTQPRGHSGRPISCYPAPQGAVGPRGACTARCGSWRAACRRPPECARAPQGASPSPNHLWRYEADEPAAMLETGRLLESLLVRLACAVPPHACSCARRDNKRPSPVSGGIHGGRCMCRMGKSWRAQTSPAPTGRSAGSGR